MPTPVTRCEKKGLEAVCAVCGRVAPDYCLDDQPEGWGSIAHFVSTGSDLPNPDAPVVPVAPVTDEGLFDKVEVNEAVEAEAKAKGKKVAKTTGSAEVTEVTADVPLPEDQA